MQFFVLDENLVLELIGRGQERIVVVEIGLEQVRPHELVAQHR